MQLLQIDLHRKLLQTPCIVAKGRLYPDFRPSLLMLPRPNDTRPYSPDAVAWQLVPHTAA